MAAGGRPPGSTVNGTTVPGTGTNQTYSTNEMTLQAGASSGGAPGTAICCQPRVFNGNIHYGGGHSDFRVTTTPVDTFKPNPWGLYQVHGNVREWTEDCWNDSHNGNPGNGSARTTGDCGRRVVRGGSWFGIPQFLRAAVRSVGDTVIRDNYLGFRLARTLDH